MLYFVPVFRAACICFLFAALVLSGQEKSRPDQAPTSYRLGPDDEITVRVSNAPDIGEKPVRIDADGYLKLPMIGRVKATGLTAEQLETELAKHLKIYIEEPEVAVSIAEFHSRPVSVIGAVGSPGVQQLQGRKTLVEVLSLAGGLRPDAAPVAKITRRLEMGRVPLPGAKDDPSGQFSIAEVDLKSLIAAKNPEKNIAILPQDVISVPRADIVYVLGDVTKAGPVPLDSGDTISVLEALSTAGGALRTAAASKAKILRPAKGGGRRTELPVNIKKIQAGKADDIDLLAGDILFVPGSDSKRISARAAEAALQAGTMALTYGVVR